MPHGRPDNSLRRPWLRSSGLRFRKGADKAQRVQRRLFRKRIREVFVLAAAITVARHDDPAAKTIMRFIERGERAALFDREQRTHYRVAFGIETRGDARPVERGNAF